MSQHDSEHMDRLRQEEAHAQHLQEVQDELADDGQEATQDATQDAPDADEGPRGESPVGESREADGDSLLTTDLTDILEERKNYEPNPEVQEALRDLREIPVRESLDDT